MGIEHDPLGHATLSTVASALTAVVASDRIKARIRFGFSPAAASDQLLIVAMPRAGDRNAPTHSCLR